MEAALTRSLSRLAAAATLALLAPSILRAGELPAKEKDLLAKLRARVQAVDARLDGVLGVYVRDLSTGATVELRPDEAFPTASSIKLAVLYELYRQADEGRIDVAEVDPPSRSSRGGRGHPAGARRPREPHLARPRRPDDRLVRQRGDERARAARLPGRPSTAGWTPSPFRAPACAG